MTLRHKGQCLHRHQVRTTTFFCIEPAGHQCPHTYAPSMDDVDRFVTLLGDAERERDEYKAELMNIALAKPSEWEPDVRDQFQSWAQHRARHTLGIADERDAARAAIKEGK